MTTASEKRGAGGKEREAFPRRSLVVSCAVLLAACLSPLAAAAQRPPSPAERLREQRDSLTRIRSERAELERRMRQLLATVHDLAEERRNLERQTDATARLVHSLDQQLVALGDEERDATGKLVSAQDELAVKRSVLRHRVREIYKRGPLYSTEAMLSAQSFGELVARYKYLHLVAQRDRALVRRLVALGQQIAGQRQTLVRLRGDLAASRQEKADEEERLRELESRSARSLAQARVRQQQTEARLAQIARDEARLASVIAALETERRRLEARPGGAVVSTSTLRTSDFGRLNWPVEGEIIYSYGRYTTPGGATLNRLGIGIAAAQGTPVKAVSAGAVMYAETYGTYGLTVILQHGGGDYSVYGSLSTIQVAKGTRVARGQVLGGVGTSDPEFGPHLYFAIHPRGRPVDPLEWLRSRR